MFKTEMNTNIDPTKAKKFMNAHIHVPCSHFKPFYVTQPDEADEVSLNEPLHDTQKATPFHDPESGGGQGRSSDLLQHLQQIGPLDLHPAVECL